MLSMILGYLNSAAAIVVVLGLCLLCHEAGHFLVAKACKMKVEEFAFGFGRALWQRRRGETLYRFNLAPFGGYVRIAGMEPGAENVERGFHSRPRWQGALVILAGSFANFVLATIIFTVVTIWTGLPDPNDHGIYVSKVSSPSPAREAGMKAGDQILGVDGQKFSLDVAAVTPGSPAAKAGFRKGLTVSRVGDTEVYTPSELLTALRAVKGSKVEVEAINNEARSLEEQFVDLTLLLPRALAVAGNVSPETALNKALGVRFDPIHQGSLVGYIAARPNKTVRLSLSREGELLDLPVTTMVTNGRYAARDKSKDGMLYSRIRPIGRIGIVLRSATRPVGLIEGVQVGAIRTYVSAATVLLSVQAMLRRQVEAELAGPVAIMAITAERARIGWDAVLNWGGVISAILAVTNLFPFAPFDGFKAVLLGFEAIIRRRVPARLELLVNVIGFFVVIALFVILMFKDVSNLVRYGTS